MSHSNTIQCDNCENKLDKDLQRNFGQHAVWFTLLHGDPCSLQESTTCYHACSITCLEGIARHIATRALPLYPF